MTLNDSDFCNVLYKLKLRSPKKKIKSNKLNNEFFVKIIFDCVRKCSELYQSSFLFFLNLYSGFNFVSDDELIVSHESTAH